MTDHPATEPLPPPPGKPSSGYPFLAGLAGGAVLTALLAGAATAAWPFLSERLLGEVDRRLSLVERATDDIHGRLGALEQTDTRSATAAQLQSLTQRLAALEGELRSGGGGDNRQAAEIAHLNAELEAVKRAIPPEGVILRLADQAGQAQRDAHQLAERSHSAQALLLVVGQLREAVNRGDPYEAELRAVRRLATAENAQDLEALAASALTGIPRRESLLSAVPTVTAEALRASLAPPDGDFWQRSLNSLTHLFSLRRVDGQGNDPQAVAARAERQAKDGDLAKTVAELSSLDGEAGRLIAPWLANAEARVAADRALSELSATAAAETARMGG